MRDPRLVSGWWAERLRRLRDERGWTQDDLALRAGITQAQVSRLEAGGQTDPRLTTLVGLADAFGMSVDALLGRPDREDVVGRRALPSTDEKYLDARERAETALRSAVA